MQYTSCFFLERTVGDAGPYTRNGTSAVPCNALRFATPRPTI